MIGLKRALGACILASALLPTVEAYATTYYVATTGNDSNPGTKDQPWRTVAYAVSEMVAGDTTYVHGGTYNEGIIRFKRSGTSTAPIKLLNYPGESPIIDFIDENQFHRIVIQNSAGFQKAIGWITIEGFELKNGYDGIKFHNLHNSTIRRNWIHDNINQGIMGQGGHHNIFDRNRISHNGDFVGCADGKTQEGTSNSICNLKHGLYMHGTYYAITNNLIYDNLALGIVQNGSSSSAYSSTRHPGPEFAGATNWIVAHNTIAYQVNSSGIVVWGSACDNARIENNIFYENFVKGASYKANGIAFSGTGTTGVTIRNNLAFASGSGGTVFIGGSGGSYTQSGNIVNRLNPEFVNAPARLPISPNFSLTAQSPAIDAGLSLTAIGLDFNGTPRPQGRAYDIGPYEYTTSCNIKPPAAPAVSSPEK